jgi:hypothetical protein
MDFASFGVGSKSSMRRKVGLWLSWYWDSADYLAIQCMHTTCPGRIEELTFSPCCRLWVNRQRPNQQHPESRPSPCPIPLKPPPRTLRTLIQTNHTANTHQTIVIQPILITPLPRGPLVSVPARRKEVGVLAELLHLGHLPILVDMDLCGK